MSRVRFVTLLVLFVAGCVGPLPIHRPDWLAGEMRSRREEFFPTAEGPKPALLRPRFGIPAIVERQDGESEIAVETMDSVDAPLAAALVRGPLGDADVMRCLAGAIVAESSRPSPSPDGARKGECRRVALSAPVPYAGHQRRAATIAADVPDGGWDFALGRADGVGMPARAPRAVWLRAPTDGHIRVVHLSDIHIGKRPDVEPHFARVVEEVNEIRPDVVIVTGDLANRGNRAAEMTRARQLLEQIDAPVVVIIGNHDIGFDSLASNPYGEGWPMFARVFHPFLFFELDIGKWRFLGFDSGPSTFSPRILTRGLSPEALAAIRARLTAARSDGRNVVLFSHAPSRAVLTESAPANARGLFGRMRDGAREFEQLLLEAAGLGQRVVHLAGHTHWSDLFEAVEVAGRLDFRRRTVLPMESSPLQGRAAIINTQSATHPGVVSKVNGHGFGFAVVDLDSDGAAVRYRQFHDGGPDVAHRD
jgi:hypothetical protein